MASCNSCSGTAPTVMCPTRMNDGRAFTDYRPRCPIHSEMVQRVSAQGAPTSSYELRMYLQKNAEALMDRNRTEAVERLIPCAPCQRPFTDQGTMAPERYVVRCDPVSCTRTEVNPYGIGDGRQYK